ncbi:MAG: FmdB family zinc ribbon protein [bacterium]
MPTYDYECEKCEYVFEQFQKINDKHLETCPKCHGKVKRLISAGAGIIFKGSGFHGTDYRSSNYNKEAKADTNTPPAACPKKDSSPCCEGCGKK